MELSMPSLREDMLLHNFYTGCVLPQMKTTITSSIKHTASCKMTPLLWLYWYLSALWCWTTLLQRIREKKAAGSHRFLSKGREQTLPVPDMTGRPVFAAEVEGREGEYERRVLKATGRATGSSRRRKHGTLLVVIVSTLQRVDAGGATETQRQQ